MKKLVLVLLLLSTMILTGCGNNVQTEDTLKIGVILPLTGKIAMFGGQSQNGIELALQENTGINIELFYEDSKFIAQEGVTAYRKLKDLNDVDVIITATSPVSLAISPLANEDEVLQMAIFTSNPAYTSPDDFTFRVSTTASVESGELANQVFKDYPEVAVFHINNEYGVGQKTTFIKEFERLGGTIITEESFLLEDNDFRTQVTKIKETNAEAVALIGEAKNAGMILKQAQELEFTPQWFGIRSVQSDELITAAGDAAEGFVYTYPLDFASEDPVIKTFVEKYTTTYGEEPTSYAVEGYTGLSVIIKALNECGSVDIPCMKDTIATTTDYPSVLGDLTFDNNGDIYYTFFMKTVKNGEFVLLE